jgi:hypothetical protein
MFSLLEGFSGYNQVLMVEPNRLKTTFKTFVYQRIPFGLINAGVNFQMEMEISFKGLKVQSVVIYLNKVMVYSKKILDHSNHIKKKLKDAGSTVSLLILRRASSLF